MCLNAVEVQDQHSYHRPGAMSEINQCRHLYRLVALQDLKAIQIVLVTGIALLAESQTKFKTSRLHRLTFYVDRSFDLT